MKKTVLVLLLSFGILSAQSFDQFVHNALQNSPYLKANDLSTQRAKEDASLVQRYKNPTLSLEFSEFSPVAAKRESGYRGALSQPLRLWGVSESRENLAQATQKQAQAFQRLTKAEFVKELALFYIDYKTRCGSVALAEEAFAISSKIAKISQERYAAGTIAKVKYLLAKVDVASAKNRLDRMKVDKFSSYVTLMAFVGEEREIELDASYRFTLSKREGLFDSAKLAFMKSSQKRTYEEAMLYSNKIEWINIYAEYEKEPEQRIARFGLDIPLALFNTKKEEKNIALLKAKQKEYLLENQKRELTGRLRRVSMEVEKLSAVLVSTQEIYREQKELLKMYEDAYKIANINLIELQNMKNQMIATKAKEIALQKRIDTNTVIYNYETGEYNE